MKTIKELCDAGEWECYLQTDSEKIYPSNPNWQSYYNLFMEKSKDAAKKTATWKLTYQKKSNE